MEWRQLQSRSLTLDHRELLLFFPFFSTLFEPGGLVSLSGKVSQLKLWNSVHECVNQCKIF